MSDPGAASFRWLRTGAAGLAAILDGIEGARRSIRLETYIFSAEGIGTRIRTALVRAAHRGVDVQVLLDAFGSSGLPDDFWRPLEHAGGRFAWFNPVRFGRFAFRNHRKIFVADDELAVIGGFNVAPEYDGDGVVSGWRDLGIAVRGPLAACLATAADELFQHAHQPPRRRWPRRQPECPASGDGWQLLLTGPDRGHRHLRRDLVQDVMRAGRTQLMSAYFFPTWRLHRALTRRAQKGCEVELILAGRSDVPLARRAGQSLYTRLLRAGVAIHEYQPQVLHAKLLVLDDVVYVGSANLDTRSLSINYEVVLRLDHPGLAAEAREILADCRGRSRRIPWPGWGRNRSWWQKLREQWAHFLLNRLDPLLARRQRRHFTR